MANGKAVRILTTSWRYRVLKYLNRPFDRLPIRDLPQTTCGVWIGAVGPYILTYAVPLTAIVYLITILEGTLTSVAITLFMTPGILVMYLLLLVGLVELAEATSRLVPLPVRRCIGTPMKYCAQILRKTFCKPVVYITPV